MDWIKKGKVWKFGDHLVPDVAIGWRGEMDAWKQEDLAKIFMINVDPEIPKKVKKGDLIIAGRNFGYGRAHGAFWESLSAVGIAGIIAKSFATPFFKSCIGRGIPVLECKTITERVSQEDELEVDFRTGEIKNLTTGEHFKTEPLPDFQIEVIEAGGFTAYIKHKLNNKGHP